MKPGELWKMFTDAIDNLNQTTAVGPSAGVDSQGPLNLPTPAVNEMQRVQQEVNPTGQGVFGTSPDLAQFLPDIPNDAAVGPETMTEIQRMVPNSLPAVSPSPTPEPAQWTRRASEENKRLAEQQGQVPDISNKADVRGMWEREIANQAKATGELAKNQYLKLAGADNTGSPGIPPKAEDKTFFDMVKQVSEVIGGGLSAAAGGVGEVLNMGYEQWQKLAPSTRLALVGAAATAYAYHKGWKKTAGDVAQGFGTLYGNQSIAEEGTRRSQLNDMASVQAATINAQGRVAAAGDKTKENAIKTASEGAITDVAKSEAFKKAAQVTSRWFGTGNISDENAPMLAQRLADLYRGEINAGRLDPSYGFATFATTPALVQQAVTNAEAAGLKLY